MNSEKNNGHDTAELNRPVASEAAPRAEPKSARKSRAWIWLIVISALGVGGYFAYTRFAGASSADKAGKGGDAANRAIPVAATPARIGNMSLFLDGLGSVTPLNTVTIRTRVDGQLMKINFIEGQDVKEKDPLFEIDPRPFQVQLEQAQGQMAKDQASLKNAKTDLARYQEAKEAVSRQQIETAASNVAQFQGAIAIDQAQIDSAKLQLTYSRITSPLTGRIGLKTVDQGNIIHANDANGLAVITQLQPIAVMFSLPEDNIPRVMKKMRALGKDENLTVEAWDRNRKAKIASGALLAVDSQIDPTSATVRFKAIFPNDDFSLFPNQFVNARLLVDTLRDVVLVPTAAIQRSPTATSFVCVVKADGTVEIREVTIGPAEGDTTAVESGLAAGETVVTDGVDRLQQGTKVNVSGGGKGGATRPTTSRASTSRPAGAGHRQGGAN